LDFEGKPLLAATLMPFQRCRAIDEIITVVPSKDVDYCREEIVKKFKLEKVQKVVAGGKTRQDSVRLGLEALEGNCDLVLIHDGVRPVISAKATERIVDAARIHRAVITGLPAKETVKEVASDQEVVITLDRRRIWLIQTPQVFRYKDIMKAHRKAYQEGWDEATDDSALIEKLGIPVKVVMGSEQNIKVTTPNDLELSRFFLKSMNW
ncbi:MAG: 2-C-methyl-D-erythritol 4-phosphate cytidylyltransferase, partial [Deltaproteobacteria bacterium]|nr:2-C-methyl-D-erythritol 4-phosphate cytidylyltransferase [Deltaproteobacteria bacterium]